ncbi:MAG: hypothetical protein KKD27_08195 [Gammaproteobacteria bacterium]|jgi:hypothetical protein|uniref:hypothetical protein n=1 Tax=Stutzerimonas xanthomarina TaxID=271420 RepID=UPI000E9410BB|nr:hypothetical protein [Stutzerimonas xanthomarina]MBU0810251.1 hypothetical protein [Gammaproteobacteria bacterium]HAW22967.1 hypothetical protein [Pseudomonas sp.]MBK3849121.1 hypothetical protein [Stutzerimonas xanthomarina]MBU0851275.1 hypothetical protein [Gammaproteobacteria bacterium]MBU1300904.1 hypothetical protein [Gammaproteobacteria bacterium]|tara:strand:+ start:3429 stop:3659 length:231 start_codon:yes stop_codon:yes gene_type:complete
MHYSHIGLFQHLPAPKKGCNRHSVSGLSAAILARRLLGRSPLQTTRMKEDAQLAILELRSAHALEPALKPPQEPIH